MTGAELYKKLSENSPPSDEVLKELRQLIFKGLSKSLNGRAGADAGFIEDMTQESLVKVLAKLDLFEERSKFSTWVFSIAIRTAFSELKRKHWNNVSLDALKEEGSDRVRESASSDNPSHETTRSELKSLLHTLIKTKLTDRQRDVILAELNGMPQDEIASQLGRKRNAIYKTGHDARRALRRELEGAGVTLDDFYASFTPKSSH